MCTYHEDFFPRRIRATSLLGVSGLQGAGFTTVQKTAEDEDLDVTGKLVPIGPPSSQSESTA